MVIQPLLNDCKRSIEKGWPTRLVDEAEVLSWDRSALTSTGLKLDGDLAVIDVDVADAGLVDALAGALDERFPELFAHGLVRHAGGPKEAWIARVDEPFRRLASRRWYRGSDPDDPAVPKHMVECFGSLGTRQFAIDGPHARNPGARSISRYRFAGGASPATTPRASLPVLPKAAYGLACDLFDEIAAAAGLTAVKESRASRGLTLRCFELDADTEIETRDYGAMTVAELERLMRARAAPGAWRRCDLALLGQLSRSDAGADRLASHQLGPLRPRHLRHDDGNDLAPARAGAVRAVRIPGAIASKEPVPMNEHMHPRGEPRHFRRRGHQPGRPGVPGEPRRSSSGAEPALRSAVPAAARLTTGCTHGRRENGGGAESVLRDAVDWMLVNYAYYKGAFMGKGGVISLVDGEISSIASLRGLHAALRARARRAEGRASRRRPSSMSG